MVMLSDRVHARAVCSSSSCPVTGDVSSSLAANCSGSMHVLWSERLQQVAILVVMTDDGVLLVTDGHVLYSWF